MEKTVENKARANSFKTLNEVLNDVDPRDSSGKYKVRPSDVAAFVGTTPQNIVGNRNKTSKKGLFYDKLYLWIKAELIRRANYQHDIDQGALHIIGDRTMIITALRKSMLKGNGTKDTFSVLIKKI